MFAFPEVTPMSAVSSSVRSAGSGNGWPMDMSYNGHGQHDGPLHRALVMRILSGHYPIPYLISASSGRRDGKGRLGQY